MHNGQQSRDLKTQAPHSLVNQLLILHARFTINNHLRLCFVQEYVSQERFCWDFETIIGMLIKL